jgi:S-adenosylmethionine/arginine decarboxylase-like enzyme
MNLSGAPAVYASFDVATCISELRPLVAAEIVVAAFQLTREIAVLDTTRVAAPVKELTC